MLFRTRPNRPELDATKIPTAIDIAWAAGIYEGEGCIRLCGGTKRGLIIQVTQKDPELLYWLRDLFGGSVTGPCPSNPCMVWNCCGDRARIFSAQIYKFLTSRRKSQVDDAKALDFLEGQSPLGMPIEEMKEKLATHYAYNNVTTWRDPENRRRMMRERYASDQAYREKKKALSRKQRETRCVKKSQNAKVVAIA